MTYTPKTEAEALLMYAAGLEYLKRTGSKLLPASEVTDTKKKPAQVDFSTITSTQESKIKALEVEISILRAENARLRQQSFDKAPNPWNPTFPRGPFMAEAQIQTVPLNHVFRTTTSDVVTSSVVPPKPWTAE